ncbi:hypothetical protein L915_01835 [Phytophthora nicotianae]|uniref:Uncharacterized protein n=3 Tax=Phytophthora nicotianae TaxID=4792 RepID=V9FYC5_PHYNI|nr:hypothetical protein F443_01908 [Phytophthora nicotianae P1569]ETK95213.1 hypothetical protein L915_01835 [Phytophthora nicotianae]ETM54894.1 hypothetical protein L914_01807 [Phytophthora nicotianae]ETO84152.1 hypothetical protein F444_01913 [Phytophthora nicotianae P1976]
MLEAANVWNIVTGACRIGILGVRTNSSVEINALCNS